MHAVLQYTYADDYLTSREAHRPAHLAYAWEAVARGELLVGGAVGEVPTTGLIIFQGDDALENARRFAAEDPYVHAGVVVSWTAEPWTTVVGEIAATPVRP
ncbi:YciI-like protein [Microbacterium gorillae]|uniref:YciI-like protein n=1 Tax=Microbacterium gorillae TaxID=1231063 RepID=UPI003D957D99